MNDKQRRKAFNSERLRLRREYAALNKDTIATMNTILSTALEQVQAILRASPTDYQTWVLPQLESQIKTVMDTVALQGSSLTQSSLASAWSNGLMTVDGPLLAASVPISTVLPSVDVRQLSAISHLTTKKITGITLETLNKIDTQLGLVVTGVQPFSDAITVITNVLDETVRYRATMILQTELSRVNSMASHLRKLQAADHLPGMKKQWRRSSRKHPRETHAAADGQIREIDEPFDIGAIKMQHPHDPKAPASEVIKCGCQSLPYMDSWEVKDPKKRSIPTPTVLT